MFYTQYRLEEVEPDRFLVSKSPEKREAGYQEVDNVAFINRVFDNNEDLIKKMRINSRTICCTLREHRAKIITIEQLRHRTITRRNTPNMSAVVTKRRRERDKMLYGVFKNYVTGIDRDYWIDSETLSIYYNLISDSWQNQLEFTRDNANLLAKVAQKYIKENEELFLKVDNIDEYKPVRAVLLPGSQIEIRFARKR